MDNNIDKPTQFLFYQGEDGNTKIQVIADSESETIWITQKGMSEIFGVEIPAISKHLKNIFNEGELMEISVISKMEITASDGKKYLTNFYNLDAIISVGYRINSFKATQFRKWATNVLKEFMIKGFSLDDERLKQGGQIFGKDYFKELLERIREIRASERLFYQKITDIYAQCSIDYDPNSPITNNFYKIIQNKLHWAIHHHTAPELIKERVGSNKLNMGLTSWKDVKGEGKILKSDVTIAKNYLTKDELTELNRVVSMYLDYAENLALKNKIMKMSDWVEKLDAFLKFNDYDILKDAGKVSRDVANSIANDEYEKFRVIQDKEYKSDFDKGLTYEQAKQFNEMLKMLDEKIKNK